MGVEQPAPSWTTQRSGSARKSEPDRPITVIVAPAVEDPKQHIDDPA
jgi:hypothetical protein